MDITDLLLDVQTELFPFHNHILQSLSQGLPFMFSYLPNNAIYNDMTLIRGPKGEKYTAKDIPNLLLKLNRISKSHFDIIKIGVE